MKKKKTFWVVAAVVFALCVAVGLIFIFSKKNQEEFFEMQKASMPVLSFEMHGEKVNVLNGHRKEMNVVAMRDTIVVSEQKKIMLCLEEGHDAVVEIQYQLCSLDGKSKLQEGTIDSVKEKMTFELGNKLPKGQEGLLILTLKTQEDSFFYYTRVVQEDEYHVKECIEYARELHKSMLEKENESTIKQAMEPSSKGDNSTLQKVTIHSSVKQCMWGNLMPKIVGDLKMDIKEAGKAYTAIQLNYQVECAGDNNEKEQYKVKEFFKVAFGTKRVYLMDYKRTMEEVFCPENVILGSKGIILGIANEQLPYKVNEEGTFVAFVQANELWCYDKKENTFSKVFGFPTKEYDVRNETDNHSIQVLSMERGGDFTFSVSGYMNRGNHEGESGVVIYHYNHVKNVIREVVFVPSTESFMKIQNELSESAYYNKEEQQLYIMADGSLWKIQTDSGKKEILIDGLTGESYVTSKDGRLLAYQTEEKGKKVTKIWDFAKNTTRTIPVKNADIIIPLGFMGDDFVYGLSKKEHVGTDATGMEIQAMHCLMIRNSKNEVVKKYEKKDVYILDVLIENNMMTLRQATKEGNHYVDSTPDYITNSESGDAESVELKSYWTDLKQTQYRLVFSKGMKNRDAKITNAKMQESKKATTIELAIIDDNKHFYVYGQGEQLGIYTDAGKAIELAKSVSGVVISESQNYIWEADNQVSWYRNFEIDRFTPKEGETTLAACVRKVISYEKKKTNIEVQLGNKSAQEILAEQLEKEVITMKGCSVKDMCYLIDKGVPVMALKDANNAILLIGYDAKTITYVEPSSGSIFTSGMEKVDEMLNASGHTFLGYVR